MGDVHYRFSGYQVISVDEVTVPPGGASVVEMSYNATDTSFEYSDGVLRVEADPALDFRTTVTPVVPEEEPDLTG